jgi:hypothetical protein
VRFGGVVGALFGNLLMGLAARSDLGIKRLVAHVSLSYVSETFWKKIQVWA